MEAMKHRSDAHSGLHRGVKQPAATALSWTKWVLLLLIALVLIGYTLPDNQRAAAQPAPSATPITSAESWSDTATPTPTETPSPTPLSVAVPGVLYNRRL